MTSEQLAQNIRIHAVELAHRTHASHIASVLSVADIVAVLYQDIMNVYPKEPDCGQRDRFILSKGHAGLAVYAALAECGFWEPGKLETYYQDGSSLSGHISHKQVPGVEFSTGSLGHGVPAAVGMAMAAELDGSRHHIYVVAGDGECEEGSVWESALFAGHHRLDRLTVIVDCNGFQALGRCREETGLDRLADKWQQYGFFVTECDGHDHDALKDACRQVKKGQPSCVIAHTVKGKGVSFMEHELLWHYKDPQDGFYRQAMKELKGEEL